MRPASVHVQPTDFHGRDSQGKQKELHKKARMETLRIMFNFCVLNTFYVQCKIEACCPYFIIATFQLPIENLTFFLSFFFHPEVLLIFLLP